MSEKTEDTFVDDMAIAAAMMALTAAEKQLHAAEEKAGASADALADAADAVAVAETKVDDYTSDDAKLPWQVAAAQSDLAKKARAYARAQRRHEEVSLELAAAHEKLADALEALEVAKSTPAAEDEESPITLLVWDIPLVAAPPELVEWVEGTCQDLLTAPSGS